MIMAAEAAVKSTRKFSINWEPTNSQRPLSYYLSQQMGPIWKDIFKRLGLYTLVGTLVPAIFCGYDCFDTWIDASASILFGTIACIVLWEGNERIGNWQDARIPWLQQPLRRFLVGVITTIVYTVGAVLVLAWISSYLLTDSWVMNPAYFWTTVLYSTVATALITLFLHSRRFLFEWRDATLRAEQLKREQLNSQYLTLKNQLQPHFLFNSLSALTTLVHQNPDQATVFIQKLSGMYRYILEYSQETMVPLQRELDFLDDYLYLMKIRFGDNLRTEMHIQKLGDWMIAPLTLQLLAENATKHNEVSKAFPLRIDVSIDPQAQTLTMSNPIQLRAIPRESTKVGLTNIRERYRMISDRPVEVQEAGGQFMVTLPLIAATSVSASTSY